MLHSVGTGNTEIFHSRIASCFKKSEFFKLVNNFFIFASPSKFCLVSSSLILLSPLMHMPLNLGKQFSNHALQDIEKGVRGLVTAETAPFPHQNSFVLFTTIFFEWFTNQGFASLLVNIFRYCGSKSSSSFCTCILWKKITFLKFIRSF